MADLPSEDVTTHPLDGGEPNGTESNEDVLNGLLNNGEDDPLTKILLEKEAKEKIQKERDEKLKKAAEDSLNSDLGKFIEMKDKLGSAAEVNEFLKARTVLEKMRNEVEAKIKDDSLPIGTATTGPTGSSENAKPSGPTDAEKAAALLEKHKLDLEFTDRSKGEIKAADRPAGFGPRYVEAGPWDVTSEKPDNAVNLTTEEWSKLLSINKAFYGFTIREEQKDIVKARRPAFILDGPDLSTVKPEFEVFDSSSIQIKEAKTDLQRSLAENGFSSHSVQASASGGAFGISAGISSGLRTSSSSDVAQTDIDAQTEYFATYNFPRTRVFMDQYTLKVSDECAAELAALEKLEGTENGEPTSDEAAEAQLRQFSERYGHVFATAFQLGGQLQSSKFASSILFEKETDQRDALKASVAASFSSTYASGSSSYSYEKQSHENEKERKISDLSTLAWTARGGNALFCANPPRWAGSVGSWTNWRIIEQEEVVTLYELLGKFERWAKIPDLFKRIARKEREQKAAEGGWSGKIKLYIDGKRLGYSKNDTNTLVVSSQVPEEDPQEPVFTVLSGNILEKAERPILDALPTDFPLILVCGEEYGRQKAHGFQIPGLFVNAHGWLKPESSSGGYICRWSLRRVEQAANPWNPRQTPPDYIQDGDQVMLFCHSIGYGPYADVNIPPRKAPAVKYHSGAQQVLILGWGDGQGGEWDKAHRYDEGRLNQDELKSFYEEDSVVSQFLGSPVAEVLLSKNARILADAEKRYWGGGWRTAIFTVKFV